MVRSKRIGRVCELTVVTPIRDGWIPGERRSFRKRLTEVLDNLQRRIDTDVPVPPSLLGTIHFARWFILEDPPYGAQDGMGNPDDAPIRPGWLVFTSNFDGDLMVYLRDFALQIPDSIDDVWRNCAGYPEGGCRDFDRFRRYVQAHQVRTQAYVVARPDLTVTDIERAIRRPAPTRSQA